MNNLLNDLVPSAGNRNRLSTSAKKKVKSKRKKKSTVEHRGPGRPALDEARTHQAKGAVTLREKELIDRWALKEYRDTTSNVVRDVLVELAIDSGLKLLPFDGDMTKLEKRIEASYDKMEVEKAKLKDKGQWQPIEETET
jgi:hypothetical protein